MSKTQQDNTAQLVSAKDEQGGEVIDGSLVIEQLRGTIGDYAVENALLKARVLQLESVRDQLIGGPPPKAAAALPPDSVRGEGKTN